MQKLLADNNTHECCERQEAQGPDMAEGIEGSQLSQARRLSRGPGLGHGTQNADLSSICRAICRPVNPSQVDVTGAVGVHEVRLPLDEAGGTSVCAVANSAVSA